MKMTAAASGFHDVRMCVSVCARIHAPLCARERARTALTTCSCIHVTFLQPLLQERDAATQENCGVVAFTKRETRSSFFFLALVKLRVTVVTATKAPDLHIRAVRCVASPLWRAPATTGLYDIDVPFNVHCSSVTRTL